MKLWNKFAAKRAENAEISGGRSKRPQNRPNTPQVLSDVHNSATQEKKLQTGAAVCGRSMVEMLGVLAIIGVLSVGGIAGYQKAMFKYKLNKFMDQMTNIIANIRTAYGTQKTVEGLNNANIKKLGLVPDDMYKTADSVMPKHPWCLGSGDGYGIFFGQASYSNFTPPTPEHPGGVSTDFSATDIFYITMNKIPTDVCIAVLTADWGSGLVGIGADYRGGSPIMYVNWNVASETFAKPGDKDYPAPYSVTRAEKLCSKAKNAGYEGSMSLVWHFKL